MKVNILMVDDRRENLLALEAVLSSLNYNLVMAESGQEALKWVLKEEFAVILLDVQMPGLNGFETAKLIKAREKSRDIPIIFVTAISQALEHVTQGYCAGGIDYIFKPFEPQTLIKKVEGFVKIYLTVKKVKEQSELLQKRTTELEEAYAELERTTIALRKAEALAEERNIHLEKLVDKRTKEITLTNQKLRLSEKRFRLIFESSPNLMEIRSLKDFDYLDVNESWQDYTGYTLKEIRDRKLELFKLEEEYPNFPPNSLPQNSSAPNPLSLGGMRNIRISYKTKAGEIRHGLLSTEKIDIEKEKCLLTVITDTTEQHLLEKEMARLDRLNLIGEMAAGIAHEIRNPMTTVRGFLQLLGVRDDQVHNKEIFELMISELDRANEIICEFLSLSKTSPLELKEQNLNSILRSLFPLIQASAFNQRKDVSMELRPLPDLELDDREIRQMLLNLTRNGLEAMTDGGLLEISTYKRGNEIVLKVQDQGKGIPPEVLPKLGTPFFTTKEDGTGLGLALCYSIAEKHQARVTVKTSPHGTIFYVRFKLKNTQAVSQPESTIKITKQ